MLSNLANIYAFLLRKYGENYSITYTYLPTYLENIIGPGENQGKIILFYTEERGGLRKYSNCSSPTKVSSISKKHDDLDLTGSPLKDDCLADALQDLSINFDLDEMNPWQAAEEYHRGVSLDKATSVVHCRDFQAGTAAVNAIGSVWFLCTAADINKTLLLQYEFNPSGFSRGIIHYKGIYNAQDVTTHCLLRSHNSIVGRNLPLETHIENVYRIQSNISIYCSWSKTTSAPCFTDLSICDVTLKQIVRLDECSPLTEEFINQLRILTTIRDDILAYKDSENSDTPRDPIYRCGIGIEMPELYETINKIMTEIMEITPYNNNECDIEDIVQIAISRPLHDLTDKLWDVLRRCASYKDLKLAFNVLFQCAARCNLVNTPTNKNRLGDIITEVANRRLAIPCLSGSEPLELLLEIGLEKLYKDYEFIFTESQVCNANTLKSKDNKADDYKENSEQIVRNVRKSLYTAVQIDSSKDKRVTFMQTDIKTNEKFQANMIGFNNSNFSEVDSANALARLLQIHFTLEHLLLLRIHLNINTIYYEICERLLSKSPRFVKQLNDALSDTMEMQISPHYVREFLDGKSPHSRRITMKSSSRLRLVQSTFYFNMENVCPPNLCEHFANDEKKFTKGNTYHHWLYRKITSLHNG